MRPSTSVQVAVALVTLATAAFPAIDSCTRNCGDINLPYPFGLADDPADCYFSQEFKLVCNASFHPPALYFPPNNGPVQTTWPQYVPGDLHIGHISVGKGELSINVWLSYDCYNGSSPVTYFQNGITITETSPFTFSSNRNIFTVVGCDTLGFLEGKRGKNFIAGCLSFCDAGFQNLEDGKCDGIGCCQLAVPEGMKGFNISLESVANYTYAREPYSCGYAFVVDKDNYTFRREHIYEGDNLWYKSNETRPLVLDWAIPNLSCNSANKICGLNTYCNNSYKNSGIRCFCNDGYEGNPYLPSNCTDIDECQKNQTICSGNKPICKNQPGSYTCEEASRMVELGLATGFAVAVLFLAFGQLYKRYLRGKLMSLPRGRNYASNGGFHMRRLTRSDPKLKSFRFFTKKELQGATWNFSAKRLLQTVIDSDSNFGGSVYIGKLPDCNFNGDVYVAVKEVNAPPDMRLQSNNHFIQEIVDLYKKGEMNMLQLLGGCFETSKLLLVYQLNPRKGRSMIDDDKDQQVDQAPDPVLFAAETAGIFANISPLLEVSLTTLVQGTLGYCKHFKDVSPESNVFCFGLVLVELLTGKLPRLKGYNKFSELGSDQLFKHCETLLDHFTNQEGEVISDQGVINLVRLIRNCLKEDGINERCYKSMKDVDLELKSLSRGRLARQCPQAISQTSNNRCNKSRRIAADPSYDMV